MLSAVVWTLNPWWTCPTKHRLQVCDCQVTSVALECHAQSNRLWSSAPLRISILLFWCSSLLLCAQDNAIKKEFTWARWGWGGGSSLSSADQDHSVIMLLLMLRAAPSSTCSGVFKSSVISIGNSRFLSSTTAIQKKVGANPQFPMSVIFEFNRFLSPIWVGANQFA